MTAWTLPPDPDRPPGFDGVEGHEGTCPILCPRCERTHELPIWGFLTKARPGAKLSLEERESLQLVLDDAEGWPRIRTVHGFSPYVHELQCDCGDRHSVVLGLDEVQPMRWKAVLHGVLTTPKLPRQVPMPS